MRQKNSENVWKEWYNIYKTDKRSLQCTYFYWRYTFIYPCRSPEGNISCYYIRKRYLWGRPVTSLPLWFLAQRKTYNVCQIYFWVFWLRAIMS